MARVPLENARECTPAPGAERGLARRRESREVQVSPQELVGQAREAQRLAGELQSKEARDQTAYRGRRNSPHPDFTSPGYSSGKRRSNSSASKGTGRPTTFQKSPSTALTNAEALPWIAYPPARPRHSPLRT